jgi:hypothetical protein
MADAGIATSDVSAARGGLVPGVYGLRVQGVSADGIFSLVRADSPRLEVSVEEGRVLDREERFGEDAAEIRLIGNGWVSLSRAGHAHFVLPNLVPGEEVIHPWLVPAAATYSGWLGRHVLHGGIYSRDGRAVAVLGDKEAGKSTLLAWLATHGEGEVLADDLVVLDAGIVYSGPRCIDLRPGTAEAIDAIASKRLVRDASRQRVRLPPCRESAEIVGVVVLSWDEGRDVSLIRMGPSEAVAVVLPHALKVDTSHRTGLLDLLGYPVWRLARPRTWESTPRVAGELAELLL